MLKFKKRHNLGKWVARQPRSTIKMFRKRSLEAHLKFDTILNKIIRGQDLYTGPQKFRNTRRLVVGEALQVFEQNNWERGTDTNAN